MKPFVDTVLASVTESDTESETDIADCNVEDADTHIDNNSDSGLRGDAIVPSTEKPIIGRKQKFDEVLSILPTAHERY